MAATGIEPPINRLSDECARYRVAALRLAKRIEEADEDDPFDELGAAYEMFLDIVIREE